MELFEKSRKTTSINYRHIKCKYYHTLGSRASENKTDVTATIGRRLRTTSLWETSHSYFLKKFSILMPSFPSIVLLSSKYPFLKMSSERRKFLPPPPIFKPHS